MQTVSSFCPLGVAQWTSHRPPRQQSQVRIPPGYKVFRKIIALLLCVFDLICIGCVLIRRKKRHRPQKNIFLNCVIILGKKLADGLSRFCADGCLHSIPFRTKPPKIEQQSGLPDGLFSNQKSQFG
jgi:hypothetical protein